MTVNKKRAKRRYLEIESVIRGYTGRGGWGYNTVTMSNGKTVNLRQKPNSLWHVGDKVPAGKIKRLVAV